MMCMQLLGALFAAFSYSFSARLHPLMTIFCRHPILSRDPTIRKFGGRCCINGSFQS